MALLSAAWTTTPWCRACRRRRCSTCRPRPARRSSRASRSTLPGRTASRTSATSTSPITTSSPAHATSGRSPRTWPPRWVSSNSAPAERGVRDSTESSASVGRGGLVHGRAGDVSPHSLATPRRRMASARCTDWAAPLASLKSLDSSGFSSANVDSERRKDLRGERARVYLGTRSSAEGGRYRAQHHTQGGALSL